MARSSHNAIRIALAGALVATASLVASSAAPAAAAGEGPQVRLGHFSPGTPPVDVYLAPLSGGGEQLVLPGLGFGQLSQYKHVEPGRYSYSMRVGGSAPTSKKMLSGVAFFSGESSYTVVAYTQGKGVKTKAFVDDNRTPPAGTARVRLIHTAANAGRVDVTVDGGLPLAAGLRLGDGTPYAELPGGDWNLLVDGTTTDPVRQTLSVAPGTVNTLLVITDGPGVKLMGIVDATGVGATNVLGLPVTGPAGAIATGGGGTARDFVHTDAESWAWLLVAPAAFMLAAAVVLRRRATRA